VDDGEFHGVYATVCNTLTDVDTSEEVSSDSARVYVVYPMRIEKDERVSMRLKIVHRITGQISYHWVVIFNPSTEERFLTDFSLIP
jgi:hypothetical protein